MHLPPDPERFVREWLAAFNNREWEAYGHYFADDVTYSTPGQAEPIQTRAGHVEHDKQNAGDGHLRATLVVAGADGRHIAVEGLFEEGQRRSNWVTLLEFRHGLIAAERLYFDRTPAA